MASRVLVIDDGELSRIRGFLDGFGIDLEHLSGKVIHEDLDGCYDLVIATVKQTLSFEGVVDFATLPGKPVWIAVHAQDFLPLRVRLQRMGVQYLVQSSVGSEALRLLLVHCLYQGPERREGMRLPVGMPVACRSQAGEGFRADLLDLTRDGCRLLADCECGLDTSIAVDLPAKLAGGAKLELSGRVSRVEPHPGTPRTRVTLEFCDLGVESAELLDAILQGKIIGTVVTRLGADLSEETASTTIPASKQERLSADSESQSQSESESEFESQSELESQSQFESQSQLELALPLESESAQEVAPEYPHKRTNLRTPYMRKVTALHGGSQSVILGRDLSIAGMRAEHIPDLAVGTELELAIYGGAGAEPVLVKAVVARDDGELGTVFHFAGMPEWDRPRLEAIVNAGSEIRSLSGDSDGDKVVVAHARERVTSLRRRR
jgi:hypothetical protein